MVASRPIDIGPASAGLGRPRCASNLASYAVPKAVLLIDAARSAGVESVAIDVTRKPDKWYCLDFTGSPTAAETITVSMGGSSGQSATPFLQAVHSTSIDETALILNKIIDTIFTVLANTNRGGEEGVQPDKKSHFEVDPFDAAELATVNRALRAYRLCLVLAGYSYDDSTATDQRYCDDPAGLAASGRQALELRTSIAEAPSIKEPGLYIRVRASYEMRVYALDKKGWRLQKTKPLSLENLSPLIQVSVDRAAFTQVKMAFVFRDGTLDKFCVVKGSEAAGFISIPIRVLNGIGAAPRRAAEARISATTGDADVVAKLTELVQVQNAFAAYQKAKLSDPNLALPPNLQAPKTPLPPINLTAAVQAGPAAALPSFGDRSAICTEADVS